MAVLGWITKWAMGRGALEASTEGRLVMEDAYIQTQHVDAGAITPVKTTGVTVPNVLGAPSVEAAGLDDVLSAVALPAAATNEVLASTALADGQTTLVEAGITNPDVPRAVAVKGNAATAVGNVVIVGTDGADAAATETIVAAGTAKVYGTQVFKTVTSITLPARGEVGDEIAVGIGRDVSFGITDPDLPRSLGVVGSQAGVAGDVVITGTNYSDATITETIVAADNTKVYGAKAFKTVTSIRVPALVGAGDTVAVGLGNKLGLHQVLAAAGQVVFCLLNRAIVAPTVAVDADEIEKNTVDLSAGTYNGAKVAVAMIYR